MAKKEIRNVKPYLLAYTIKFTTRLGQNRIVDHYEIFCEHDDINGSPKKQAYKRKDVLEVNKNTDKSELYCWNICKIESTSEHY